MTGEAMARRAAKALLRGIGVDPHAFMERFGSWSIDAAIRESGLTELVERLRQIVPDISAQESRAANDSPFIEIKRRGLHAAQCRIMLDALDGTPAATVIDIGDSAGTHMLYLRALTAGETNVEAISVNLDPRAIEKIRARGLTALQCRAEELTQEGIAGDASLFTSFEMVEHLHNPALFFRRLATKAPCSKMVVSVPYLKRSRVGLHHIRHGISEKQFAEDVHVFELSPEDWTRLMLHAGWRVTRSAIYYQYPRRWWVVSRLLGMFWSHYDFEGFWCAVLERDTAVSDLYCDWET